MEQIEANIAVLLTVHDRKNKTLRCLENLYKQVLPNYLRLDIYLTDDEQSRVIQSLINLKNNLIAQGRYTDAVDDVLCKVLIAKKKKVKI